MDIKFTTLEKQHLEKIIGNYINLINFWIKDLDNLNDVGRSRHCEREREVYRESYKKTSKKIDDYALTVHFLNKLRK